MAGFFSKEQKRKIEEAREKEAIILPLLKGQKLEKVLAASDTEFSLTGVTWSRLKKRYKESGFWGLIDNRGRKGRYKVDNEIINYKIGRASCRERV